MLVCTIESPARHTIAVASGKGGVGKSTVTLNLALAERGTSVRLLDADLYGPDIPAMLGRTPQTLPFVPRQLVNDVEWAELAEALARRLP